MAQPVNVFVVDTHAIYRRGLVASLELLDEVDAVDEADGAEAAWAHPALDAADIVIVDPTIAGGAAFLAIVGEATGASVVACSSTCEGDAVRSALAAGVTGYLRKDTLTHGVLRAAVAAAGAGVAVVAAGAFASPATSGSAFASSATNGAAGAGGAASVAAVERWTSAPLSEREQRVLALIAEGHPTREVATALSYSERTVKSVLHDVLTKLNARSRSHAIAYAVREGLI
jgi:two-component system NarL family response regulator